MLTTLSRPRSPRAIRVAIAVLVVNLVAALGLAVVAGPVRAAPARPGQIQGGPAQAGPAHAAAVATSTNMRLRMYSATNLGSGAAEFWLEAKNLGPDNMPKNFFGPPGYGISITGSPFMFCHGVNFKCFIEGPRWDYVIVGNVFYHYMFIASIHSGDTLEFRLSHHIAASDPDYSNNVVYYTYP